MKVNDIKSKYLVLGKVFDDFATATETIDFSKEDLVSQVIATSNVYYWLNTESVWGPMGFTWINSSKNIGKFNESTLKFSIIPKIPDSKRHTSISGILQDILNRSFTILDSDWSHIKNESFNVSTNLTTYPIVYYLDSIKGNNNYLGKYKTYPYQDGNRQIFILHGNLQGNYIQGQIAIRFIPENKNTLNIGLGNNLTLFMDFSMIHDESIDLLDYCSIISNKPINSTIQGNNNLIISSDTNKITYPAIFKESSEIIFPLVFDLTESTIDELTIVFPENMDYSECTGIKNGVGYNMKVRKMNYVGIDRLFSAGYKINVYYNHVLFDDIPEITDYIINNTSESVFSDCKFLTGYNYSNLPATYKLFNTTYPNFINIPELEYKTTVYFLEVDGTTRSGAKVVDYEDYFPLSFDNEHYTDTIISFPKVRDISFYRFSTGNLEYGNKDTTSICPKPGNSIRLNLTNYYNSVTLLLPEHDNGIIIDANSKVYNLTIHVLDINSINPKGIYFDIDESNILLSTNSINNSYIGNICKKYAGYFPKYVFRETDCFWSSFKFSLENTLYPPAADEEIYIYRSNIDITTNLLSSDVKSRLLNSIYINDAVENDAQGKTLKMLESDSALISDDLKQRMLTNGYTIIYSI